MSLPGRVDFLLRGVFVAPPAEGKDCRLKEDGGEGNAAAEDAARRESGVT